MITKKFKRKTITICPECFGIADMAKTGSTVVIIESCPIHKRREETPTISNFERYEV